jgi:hypothetical protein
VREQDCDGAAARGICRAGCNAGDATVKHDHAHQRRQRRLMRGARKVMASYEQRLNASAIARIANARALLVGSFDDFPVLFENGFTQTETGASASRPLVTALDADVAGVEPHQSRLAISGAATGNGTYAVMDKQPDGTGMTTMVLEAS